MEVKDTLTRNYIIEAFYNLLIKKPFNNISVSDVCAKAGVSRMSFYRNFKSKEDLANKSIELVMKCFKEKLNQNQQINQYIVTKEIFSTAEKYKDAFNSFKNTEFIKNFIDTFAHKIFENAPEDKIDKTKKYGSVFYFSALTGVLTYWINHGAKESPEEMAKGICNIADFPFFSDCSFNKI